MRKLNEKADECDFNLRNYYNTTNAATFQEKSIMFFLANAAAIDNVSPEKVPDTKTFFICFIISFLPTTADKG